MVDGFYRSKDPTNSIKVLKEATKENKKKHIHTYTYTQKYEIVQAKKITARPIVYSNMG